MACGVKQQQLNELDRALQALERAGLGPGTGPYDTLAATRTGVSEQIGYKFPRQVPFITGFRGLSPGEIRLFHDIEAGWLVEGRAEPGAPVARRYVPADIAITLLKGELTHELEEYLMTPDPYIGE